MATAVTERTGLEVRLEGLSRHFGDVRALDNLDLTLHPGELVALLGPSGCGKTTALRLVAGLDEPDAGRILVGDRDVTHMPANKRDMGMVFQSYSLFPHLTTQENVAFGLKLRGTDRGAREKRAKEMLELVGLGHQANRYANQLSGGQQQRVALARALAIEPSVLLLDEPLSALDAKVRAQLRDEIRRVQLEVGTTALFVTHDQEEALAVADRVGVMNKGKIEQLAEPETLYNQPASHFVAEFVGLMNRVPCHVADGRVEVLGATLGAREGSLPSGPGDALVRPEQLEVAAAEGGSGRVITVSFLGSITRVRVRMPNGSELLAQASGAEAARLAADQVVTVSITAADVLVAPAD
ncbi:ABC transporter ATP-binding protein [Leekyejoonella antrihumi]|uniref:ABC-type quaternary amine transporter n=1 Tax=Leekyejoonella antrihumi TaxID=1660198 RepID=A0A563E442_9MICO|nr:ABC transporter ATP-binding protein [Leekyejoonella antrihumi]TWP37286.1 ABC transporter ATP-binding protein [Leekyejoonella antrihumi]